MDKAPTSWAASTSPRGAKTGGGMGNRSSIQLISSLGGLMLGDADIGVVKQMKFGRRAKSSGA